VKKIGGGILKKSKKEKFQCRENIES